MHGEECPRAGVGKTESPSYILRRTEACRRRLPAISVKILDAKGLKDPMPIIKAKKEIDAMSPGDLLEVHATDPGSVADFQGWSKTSKTASLTEQRTESGSDGKTVYIHVLERT